MPVRRVYGEGTCVHFAPPLTPKALRPKAQGWHVPVPTLGHECAMVFNSKGVASGIAK